MQLGERVGSEVVARFAHQTFIAENIKNIRLTAGFSSATSKRCLQALIISALSQSVDGATMMPGSWSIIALLVTVLCVALGALRVVFWKRADLRGRWAINDKLLEVMDILTGEGGESSSARRRRYLDCSLSAGSDPEEWMEVRHMESPVESEEGSTRWTLQLQCVLIHPLLMSMRLLPVLFP